MVWVSWTYVMGSVLTHITVGVLLSDVELVFIAGAEKDMLSPKADPL